MHVRTLDSRRLDGRHLGVRGFFLEAQQSLDFEELAHRLTAFGLRTFNEFGLGGRDSTVAGVGLSVDDFVSAVLVEYVEGKLQHQASRGDLFSLLATALRSEEHTSELQSRQYLVCRLLLEKKIRMICIIVLSTVRL